MRKVSTGTSVAKEDEGKCESDAESGRRPDAAGRGKCQDIQCWVCFGLNW